MSDNRFEVTLINKCCGSGNAHLRRALQLVTGSGVKLNFRMIHYKSSPDRVKDLGLDPEDIHRNGPMILCPQLDMRFRASEVDADPGLPMRIWEKWKEREAKDAQRVP